MPSETDSRFRRHFAYRPDYLLSGLDSIGAVRGSSGIVRADSETLPESAFRNTTMLSTSSFGMSLPNCALPMMVTALSSSHTLPLWKYG
ncbi:Uncharacterised protein [Neisseria gonorrhoeae]|uniref:Uncharacterized protein n=1 Tax=Neisseria gonorrhoeae TaxID=485 RepID=A0A379B1C9_NEIGO|nr:Uncharacterised protein [Neisseria gonorrhoeae]